jgi:multidrug transporter EmrE-like cation transporter
MKVLALVMTCVCCNVTAQLLIKLGASSPSSKILQSDPSSIAGWWGVLVSWPTITGIGLWIVSTLFWIYILVGSDLSYAYALYGLNYVATPLFANWYFKESMNGMQYLGVASITLGVGLTIAGKLR